MDEIEEEAKAAAEKMVMNMMQRPGQLEKVCTTIKLDHQSDLLGFQINSFNMLEGRLFIKSLTCLFYSFDTQANSHMTFKYFFIVIIM